MAAKLGDEDLGGEKQTVAEECREVLQVVLAKLDQAGLAMAAVHVDAAIQALPPVC